MFMSNEQFFDELQRDLKTNVFSLVAMDASVNYKEFKKGFIN